MSNWVHGKCRKKRQRKKPKLKKSLKLTNRCNNSHTNKKYMHAFWSSAFLSLSNVLCAELQKKNFAFCVCDGGGDVDWRCVLKEALKLFAEKIMQTQKRFISFHSLLLLLRVSILSISSLSFVGCRSNIVFSRFHSHFCVFFVHFLCSLHVVDVLFRSSSFVVRLANFFFVLSLVCLCAVDMCVSAYALVNAF